MSSQPRGSAGSDAGDRPTGSNAGDRPGDSDSSGSSGEPRSAGPPRRVDTDERRLVLVWELTQACELTCEHCRADAQPDRHPDELTTTEAERLLSGVRAFGEGQLVVFLGGDPLMRDDAVHLVEYGSDIGLNVTVTPSGTNSLTRDAVADLADAGLRRMALGVDDATAERHDAFRGEAGSFADTMRAAVRVRRDRIGGVRDRVEVAPPRRGATKLLSDRGAPFGT